MNAQITELTNNDLLLVQGEDSAKFLQGQLTCDVNTLTAENFSYGAICNTKGRVICTFIITRTPEDPIRFLLVLAKGMGERVIQHLGKYKVFYKTEILDCESSLRHFGLTGAEAEKFLKNCGLTIPAAPFQKYSHKGVQLLRLPDNEQGEPRIEILVPESSLDKMPGLTHKTPGFTENQWQAEGLVNGFFFTPPEHTEAFTPEELSLDLLGAISFTKGCYTGQEIVARMHYRGKTKKRLFYFTGKVVELPEEPSKGNYVLADKNLKSFRDKPVILLKNNNIIAGLFPANIEVGSEYNYLCHGEIWHTTISVCLTKGGKTL